jgi:serine/threonine protein kinase
MIYSIYTIQYIELLYMIKKGGKLYGQGGFGAVFGNPRLPCHDETIADVIDKPKELSKVYRGEAYLSITNKELFEIVFKNTTTLKKYFSIPLKICRVNFDNPEFQTVYNADWIGDTPNMKLEDGVYSVLNVIDMYYTPDEQNPVTQQVLERGDDTLVDILGIKLLKTFNIVELFKCIDGICHLFEGLCYLHLHQMYHLDIKYNNIMRFGDTFKFIDIDYFTPSNKLMEKYNKRATDEHTFVDTIRMGYMASSPLQYLYLLFPPFDKTDQLTRVRNPADLLFRNPKWIYMYEDYNADVILDIMTVFMPLFMSVKSHTLTDEQKTELCHKFNELFNFYLMDMPRGNPEYYIYHTDSGRVISHKMRNIHTEWKRIMEEKVPEDPTAARIIRFMNSYKAIVFHPHYDTLEIDEQNIHYDRGMDFLMLHTDVCGFSIMVLMAFSKILRNSAYSHAHNTIYELMMLSVNMILKFPIEPMEIEEFEPVIKKNRTLFKQFRNRLHCQYPEYFGDKSGCVVMGGRRNTKRHRRKHRRTVKK